jgi:hypothetical protein
MLLTSLLAGTQRDEQNKACEMACIKKPKRSSSSSNKLVNRRLKKWLVTQWGSDLNQQRERAQG